MNPRTLATLDQLKKAHWFANVGRQDTHAAVVLTSWKDAVASCASIEWENLNLEAANQFRERLAAASMERFSQWNTVVEKSKVVIEPLVKEKTDQIIRINRLGDEFFECVRWDILHLCMEAEFADICKPGYYASQAYWYVKGHFPCGWQGLFPKGKIIIY